MTILDEPRHDSVEHGHEQKLNMATVVISVREQDDLAVTHLRMIEQLHRACADRRDNALQLLVVGHETFRVARGQSLLNVQALASNRQKCLVERVAGTLRRTHSGVTLDDEHFCLLAMNTRVAQLGRHRAVLLRLGRRRFLLISSCLSGLMRLPSNLHLKDALFNECACLSRVLLHPGPELAAKAFTDHCLGFGVIELALSLALELGVSDLDRDDDAKAGTNIRRFKTPSVSVNQADMVLSRIAVEQSSKNGLIALDVRTAVRSLHGVRE